MLKVLLNIIEQRKISLIQINPDFDLLMRQNQDLGLLIVIINKPSALFDKHQNYSGISFQNKSQMVQEYPPINETACSPYSILQKRG